MVAEAIEAADVSWHGLAGDRRWAFIRDGMTRSGFPWLTIRYRPTMWRYTPRFTEPDRPVASPVLVRTPSGAVLEVWGSAACLRQPRRQAAFPVCLPSATAAAGVRCVPSVKGGGGRNT